VNEQVIEDLARELRLDSLRLLQQSVQVE